MAINYNIENNNLEKKSFALLRTNPKLSSNIKLIVDSIGDMFLGAFKANKSLSKVEYQKFEINQDGSYSNDVSRFFKGIPVNERFQILRKNSDLTPYSDYAFQYEQQYNSGARFNSTKLYDEQYKVFAPIWIDRQIPKKFVVYRVLDVEYKEQYSEDTLGQNSRILELLKNATIIKTFDLTKESKLGKYLHNHVYDKGVPKSCINFNFGGEASAEFKGIDTTKGGFASKKEFLGGDYIRKDNPEIYANGLLSSGFERHGLISANLINMEFMFDDTTATDYEIYRYFGLYVDDIEEGSFNVDAISKSGIISIKPGTCATNYDLSNTALYAEDMIPNESDLSIPMLSYVKLGKNKYTNIINNTSFVGLKLPIAVDVDRIVPDKFVIIYNKLQVSQVKASNKAFIKFEITETPNLNDRFYIGDKTEIEILGNSLFDFTCIADSTLPKGTFSGNKFSTQGGLNQIAIAISRLITKITNYTCTFDGSSIIIEDYAPGDNRKRMSFGILQQNLTDFIKVISGSVNTIGLTDPQFNDWDLYTADGGSKVGASFLVESSDLANVHIGLYVKEKNLNKFNKITNIIKDPRDQLSYRIILQNSFKIPNDNIIQLYEKFRPSFGKFSAYDIKDFDFDFYSTSNSDVGELKIELETETGKAIANAEFLAGNPGTSVEGLPHYPTYLTNFDKLTPVLKAEDIDTDTNQEQVFSEYDRLSENALQDTALKSRMVPSIMKFSLKNGTNARNLPYVLNSNEAFGPDNLSPNILLDAGRNSDNLNMEHFHFNKITNYIYEHAYSESLRSYTDFNATGGITIDALKSTDVDYFKIYFKWSGLFITGSSGYAWVDDAARDLFTKFGNGIGNLDTSTIFRGLRYVYKKRKEDTKTNPTEFISGVDVNDYKFGVTLNYNNDEEKNSVDYTVIKNDTFKFICVVLDLNVVNNDIETLSRSMTYTAKDIRLDDTIVSSRIPFLIDLGHPNTDWNDSEPSVFAIDAAPPNGATFISTLNPMGDGSFSWIYFTDSGGNIWGIKVTRVVSNNEIKVLGRPEAFDPAGATPGPLSNGSYYDMTNIGAIPFNQEYFYWNSGDSGFKNLFEEIVSYNYANRFNKFGKINYITVGDTGETLNDFVLQIEDGIEFAKPSILDTTADGDKPKAYQLVSGEIGKVIKARDDGGYYTLLRRFNGDYNPIFKECVGFTDVYNSQSLFIPDPEIGGVTVPALVGTEGTYGIGSGTGSGAAYGASFLDVRKYLIYSKFKNTGIAFGSFKNTNDGYGFIKNMYYHKANDENSKNLLKLSETSDKLPLYPLIGEIAIDKSDFNVFKSKYASDYYIKSLQGGMFERTPGTLNPIEDSSFMVSTIMKVKDQYDLTSFSQTTEVSLDSLDSIRFNKLNKSAIHWLENDSEIIADFYLPKAIYNELLEDGILNKFSKYVKAEKSYGDKSSIKDDLEIYVYENIINRFIIDNIEVYGIQGKNLETSFVSVNSPEELTTGGYTAQTNLDIQGYQNDGLSFRLIYNKKPGYKYNLKLHIKIQA
jgi:hypothetical protein